jgi:exonuclease 1
VDITPVHAYHLIKAAKRIEVECIVAPYEADAELAYLCKSGIADIVITEDSDLIAFGVQRVFFKFDWNGNGVEIDLRDLKKNVDMTFDDFD